MPVLAGTHDSRMVKGYLKDCFSVVENIGGELRALEESLNPVLVGPSPEAGGESKELKPCLAPALEAVSDLRRKLHNILAHILDLRNRAQL